MNLGQLLLLAYTQAVAAESDGPNGGLLTMGTGDDLGVSLVAGGCNGDPKFCVGPRCGAPRLGHQQAVRVALTRA